MARERRVLAIVSGGVDSVTMLHYYRNKNNTLVKALSFDYGQRHIVELSHASLSAMKNRIGHVCIRLPLENYLQVPLTGEGEIPDGHYTDATMKKTIVPNRNAIFLSIAYGCAVAWEYDVVAYAAHKGDHPIYPDCREEFVTALAKALQIGNDSGVVIEAPFINKTKGEIIKIGSELGVDYRWTYSCYKGGEHHCGTCGTCVERKEAFALAKVPDPTTYKEK